MPPWWGQAPALQPSRVTLVCMPGCLMRLLLRWGDTSRAGAGNEWLAVLTCTVSPLWTARSLLFQRTTGWGLPTAVQVRLSVSWSRTSTNAGGVSRKVGGAVKTSPDPHPQVRLNWSWKTSGPSPSPERSWLVLSRAVTEGGISQYH